MSGKRLWGQKYRADGKVAPPFKEKKVPSTAWRKKWDCKINKGDHSWVFANAYGGSFKRTKDRVITYYVRTRWQCSACGHYELEYGRPKRKFDNGRHTIYQ